MHLFDQDYLYGNINLGCLGINIGTIGGEFNSPSGNFYQPSIPFLLELYFLYCKWFNKGKPG